MNWLDVAIIVTMGFLVVRGIFRGFLKEIASLAGVVLGIWLGGLFQPGLTAYLKVHFASIPALALISFGVVFVAVVILCNLTGLALKALVKKAFLGWADRALGVGLALVKGLVVIYLGIVLLTFFVPGHAPVLSKSRLAPLIISSYQSMVGLISPDTYERWKRRFLDKPKEMKETLQDKAKGLSG
jgi:membrane protein required for colicin V production